MDIQVRQLRIGDLVDLEGDGFADPQRKHTQFESELAEVVAIENETPGCIAVSFEGFDTVGFPPDHFVRVRK